MPFSPCIFAQQLGCKCCTKAYHKECVRFVTSLFAYNMRALGKFKPDFSIKPPASKCYATSELKAKSAVAVMVRKLNAPVTSLSIGTCLDMSVDRNVPQDPIIYIHYDIKFNSEKIETIHSCINTFIEQCPGRVVMWVSPLATTTYKPLIPKIS